MATTANRRKSLFGAGDMKMLDIQKRANRPRTNSPYLLRGGDVLPWIEQHTEGDFYLSDFSVGFKEENDLLMFMLAFNR